MPGKHVFSEPPESSTHQGDGFHLADLPWLLVAKLEHVGAVTLRPSPATARVTRRRRRRRPRLLAQKAKPSARARLYSMAGEVGRTRDIPVPVLVAAVL